MPCRSWPNCIEMLPQHGSGRVKVQGCRGPLTSPPHAPALTADLGAAKARFARSAIFGLSTSLPVCRGTIFLRRRLASRESGRLTPSLRAVGR